MSVNINSFGQTIPFSQTAEPVIYVVSMGETQRVERRGQLLRVMSGQAWVSFDGYDFCVRQGATIRLQAGSNPAVISMLGQTELVCEIC